MKTRFCPSPTGYMHLGNARTALFNALLAVSATGHFLLRIEDTDKSRSNETFTAVLQNDLRWLGIVWQEGPMVGGEKGPYWQSERQAIYDKYYQQLEAASQAYPCFCSEQQLALARKVQLASGQPPRYAGICRKLSVKQIQEKLTQGEKPNLRFEIPQNTTINFTDLVRGEQVFKTQDIGDFIIRRADGTASFLFCNIIDDALMGVTHALRGEDHLTNTPRQLLIAQALNLTPPIYGHISMIMGPDGSPLSKRHGSKSIKDLRESGYFSLALTNYMARLGHYYEDNQLMNINQLAAKFSPELLGAAPARYDASQLLHWQKEAIQHADAATIWEWMGQPVHALVPSDMQAYFVSTIRLNSVFPADAQQWAEILFAEKLEYDPEISETLQQAGLAFFNTAILAVKETGIDYQALCSYLQTKLAVKGKALFRPLRAALTGQMTGPDLPAILQLLGKERVLARFQAILKSIKA